MAIRYIPPSLNISIQKNTLDPKFYLEQYFNGVDNIVRAFGKRASRAIVEIAPYNYGDLGNLGSQATAGREYEPLKYSIDTYYDETRFKVDVDNDNEYKMVAQEFGYTASIAFWKGPYKPNPKRKSQYAGTPAGRIKGVGFVRAGIVLASSSLLKDKVDYYRGPKMAEVRDYKAVVKDDVKRAIAKYTLAFSKSRKAGIPSYMLNKVQLPETAVGSKFTSTYFPGVAKLDKLAIRLPISASFQGISLGGQIFIGGIKK